jgi:hypothetical protein
MSVDDWFRGTGSIEDRITVVICFVYRMLIECGSLFQETDAFSLRED